MDSNSPSMPFNHFLTINNSSRSITIPLSPLKKYWCHICKKSFPFYEINSDIKCPFCNKTFCELLNTQDISDPLHPIHFEPFVLNNSTSQNRNNLDNNYNNNTNRNTNLNEIINLTNIINRQIMINDSLTRTGIILEYIHNYLLERNIQNYNNYINNVINQISLLDANNYGNPPAAKKEIEKLKKIKINEEILKKLGIENSCAVCKDEFQIEEECLLMPCNHHFHENCLIPWLKKRNSCPVCRYELLTDDKDFEEMKKLKLKNNNNHHQ